MEKIELAPDKEKATRLTDEYREYIKAQMQLPRSLWDDDFKAYVEEKRRRAFDLLKDDSPEVFDDKSREKRYAENLDNLRIRDEEYLKDKDVIDLGCGDGEFVFECLKRGKAKRVRGLDLEIREELQKGEYKNNFFQGDFTKELPFKNADLIVSDGGVNVLTFDDDGAKAFERVLRNCIRILSENGEIRIAPINCFHSSDMELVGLDQSKEHLMSVLKKLSDEKLIEYRLEPIDIQVSGIDFQDVWLFQALIIRKMSAEKEEK